MLHRDWCNAIHVAFLVPVLKYEHVLYILLLLDNPLPSSKSSGNAGKKHLLFERNKPIQEE